MTTRQPFLWACALAVGVLVGVLAGVPAMAQDGRPSEFPKSSPPAHPGPARPAGSSSGASVGLQIDLLGLFKALRSTLQPDAVLTEWPDAQAALALHSLPPEQARAPAPDGDFVCEPGELLVFWPSPQAAEAGLRELRDNDQLSPVLRADLPALGAALALYRLADNEAALALRANLRSRHPDWAVDLNVRSASQAGPRLFAFGQLQLQPVAAQGPDRAAAGAGTRVGVIDGPTDAQADLLVAGFAHTSLLQPGEVPAPVQHGNAVARLLAAKPTPQGFGGVAPGVHLHWATVTRLVQGRERSNTLAQVLALDWQLGQQVHIVNISMGGPSDAVLAAAYRRATALPVVFLAAAGNSGPTAAAVYPAAYPGVLAVTAVDALTQVYAWANQGPQVSLAAPGVDVWVPTAADGAGQYLNGTSFATALASGMLARWGPARLQKAHAEKLMPICRAAVDLGAAGKDPVFGCGLVR